jgi:hypothetical protein
VKAASPELHKAGIRDAYDALMSTVNSSIPVLCPYADAVGYLESYLALNRGLVRLEIPFASLGLPTGLGLGLEALVRYTISPSRTGPASATSDTITVEWSARTGGPYPSFSGTLRVEPNESLCRLTIEGAYIPPLGALGAAFDKLAGRRIADATVAALLKTLAGELEKRALTRGFEVAYPSAHVLSSL